MRKLILLILSLLPINVFCLNTTEVPLEIFVLISNYLNKKDYYNLSLVSRKFDQIGKKPQIIRNIKINSLTPKLSLFKAAVDELKILTPNGTVVNITGENDAGDMFSQINIIEISTEDELVFILSDDGLVQYYSLKNPKQIENVHGLENIVKISSGFSHSLALTTDGKVYGWGKNNYGQIGNGKENSDCYKPTIIEGLKNITQISCGKFQNLALDAEGNVFGWGLTSLCGQNCKLLRPTLLNETGPKNIVAIANGSSHNLVLTSDHKVFARGCSLGHLGLGHTVGELSEVKFPEDVIAIAGSENCTLFLTKDGKVFQSLGWDFNFQEILDNALYVGTLAYNYQACNKVFWTKANKLICKY